MGNESGEWIMHGMKWDNPDCMPLNYTNIVTEK